MCFVCITYHALLVSYRTLARSGLQSQAQKKRLRARCSSNSAALTLSILVSSAALTLSIHYSLISAFQYREAAI